MYPLTASQFTSAAGLAQSAAAAAVALDGAVAAAESAGVAARITDDGASSISGQGGIGEAPPSRDERAGSVVQISGVPKGTPSSGRKEIIKRTILEGLAPTLARVKPGDTVAVLPAVNSPQPYPRTTSTEGINAALDVLRELGAEPYIAVGSGIEYALRSPGVNYGSTTECAARALPGVEVKACEDYGFTKFTTSHWPNGMHVSDLFANADHILVDARMSAHAMSLQTLALKSFVGLLSDESRVEEMHLGGEGPLNPFIKWVVRGSGLRARHGHHPDFFARIPEIALPLRDKLLGGVIEGTLVPTTLGPNEYLLELGGLGLFRSYVYEPPTGLVMASTDLVAVESAALAFLIDCYRHTPIWARFLQKVLLLVNWQVEELGKRGVFDDPMIRHARHIGLGNKPSSIETRDVPLELRHMLEQALGLPPSL